MSKKNFAGGAKKKKMDPSQRDFDVLFIGGLNAANMIKYFQHKHFHGSMCGFTHRTKFMMEHLYDYLIANNMKSYKYLAMPFSSNYEVSDAKYVKEKVCQINPDKNEVVTERGDIFKYNALVLNTGLEQKGANVPFIKDLINDEFGKTRVFVQEPSNSFQVVRNSRIFLMHKDGDFLLYIPKFPSKREAYDHWYFMLDTYLTRSVHMETRPRGMRIKVITPNSCLFKFPFANEVMMEEISGRALIDVHFGMELTNVEVKDTVHGMSRIATFKDLKTGLDVNMNFGTLLMTPESKKRECYQNNDIADEDGQVKVNPYTLQHVKYDNIFAFGDCANVPTTKNLYATLNQAVVVRNNLWDYLHGTEMKAVYEGYSCFNVNHAIDKHFVFKHTYNYEPTAFNFYVPRFLGWLSFKLKNSLERNYFSKIYQKKMNFGYPYLSKDRYFRPLNENSFVKTHKLTKEQLFPHEYKKPVLSFEKEHGHSLAEPAHH